MCFSMLYFSLLYVTVQVNILDILDIRRVGLNLFYWEEEDDSIGQDRIG